MVAAYPWISSFVTISRPTYCVPIVILTATRRNIHVYNLQLKTFVEICQSCLEYCRTVFIQIQYAKKCLRITDNVLINYFFAKEFQRYPLSVHRHMCRHHQICVASQGSEKRVLVSFIFCWNFCYHFQPRQWDFISMLQRAVQRQYPAERAGLCSQQHTWGEEIGVITIVIMVS